ncbi:MAG: hypothetical protein VYC17_05370 [Nitrospinota bacterium]|nr:hypothetical protein [Nitrospinota bacterium]
MTLRSPYFPAILLITFLVSCQTSSFSDQFSVQDAYEKGQAEIYPGRFYPDFDAHPLLYKSLNPLVADEANELIPIPDKVQNVTKEVNFIEPYRQLLNVEPRDSVRSQIFDANEFNQIKKITVEPFQNKTTGPNRDASAGRIVTSQVYQELRDSKNYTVVDPYHSEDILLEAVGKKPGPATVPEPESGQGDLNMSVTSLIGPGKEAIMTGVVTKYVDTYINRHGSQQKSLSSGVAFAAYLVTPEGKVIWGARFIGSQRQNFRDFIKYQGRWLTKEEFSKIAMRDVLKDFYNSRSSMR